jgi:penicillin G amidase
MRKLLWPILAMLVVLAVGVAAIVAASLPRRGGDAAVAGLDAPVTIELDARAVPRIRAATIADAYRAQGFVHAQERFFQMDLGRRSAAGELSALFGTAALPVDRERRVFQLRARARGALASLPAEHRQWLEAYTDGVNAGIADLGARPPEYWLLRARPTAWRAEDTLLVIFALYRILSSNDAYERPQAVLEATLPDAVYAFLTPSTSRFDRPLGASADDPSGGYRPLPIPPSAEIGAPPRRGAPPVVQPPPYSGASNSWAVGAARGAGNAAIVANDPHLGLRLPNVFHRAELHFEGRALRGLGIPGVPGIVIGATGDIAWGLTVSNADQSDWVIVEPDPTDGASYLVPEGAERYIVEHELIEVKGGAEPERLEVRLTRWGPLAGEDGLGRPLALRATWLDRAGINVSMLDLAYAQSVSEGLDVVSAWAGPSLSWAFADAQGRVGWAVNGPLPERDGFDGSSPRSWAGGAVAWTGYAAPPRILGSEHDALFTANSRVLPFDAAERLGRMWMPPFRAKRIADRLDASERFDERDFAALQLDTRAEAYDLFHDVVLEVLDEAETDPVLAAARAAVAAWNGRADPSEVGFRLLHAYYRALLEHVLVPLLAPAVAADPAFVYRWPLSDEPVRRLLDERPAHLLPEGFPSWQAYLRGALVETIQGLADDPQQPGPEAPWGNVNRLDAAHPLAGIPLLGRLLRLPAVPQPGSPVSVRVAEPSRGAVARMVVSPSRPEAGILQLAGGQSGHFLSRHFDDQWRAWDEGSPAPFLAGEPTAAFTLVPEPAADQSKLARSIDGGS